MGIRYKEKRTYKYILVERTEVETGISISVPVYLGPLTVRADGTLVIDRGYAWDGPSGPTIDTKTFMAGSLAHDALYQLIREGILPPFHRHRADIILRDMCLKDGMSKLRAWYVYRAVRAFGGKYCKSDTLIAP